MAQKKGYDVLRFITHGKGSYISTTYVEGVTLFQWISEAPMMKKCDCIRMLHEISKQLELYHKSKGNPVYQYVNPYCIVLSEDRHIYLIDMKAESNGERLRKMQSRKIRERFLPEGDPYYQNSGIQTDLFGFGRTLQYMMAAVELSKPLTRKEERQIKNVINRCLGKNPKKRFEDIATARKHLPQMKEEDREIAFVSSRRKMLALPVILLLLVVAAILAKDYLEKSRTESVNYGICSSVESFHEEAPLEQGAIEKVEAEPGEAELFEKLDKAQSLETLGRFLDAADLYEEMLISLENIQEKERLYEKVATIYMQIGNYDKAYEVLEFGMAELVPSDYLWNSYLQFLTNNEEIPDEQKLNYVETFMENNTEYDKKKYQKLFSHTEFYQAVKGVTEDTAENAQTLEKTEGSDRRQ